MHIAPSDKENPRAQCASVRLPKRPFPFYKAKLVLEPNQSALQSRHLIRSVTWLLGIKTAVYYFFVVLLYFQNTQSDKSTPCFYLQGEATWKKTWVNTRVSFISGASRTGSAESRVNTPAGPVMKFGAGSTNRYIYIYIYIYICSLRSSSCTFSHPPTLLIMKQKILYCTARWLVKCSNKDSKHRSCLPVPKISLNYGLI